MTIVKAAITGSVVPFRAGKLVVKAMEQEVPW